MQVLAVLCRAEKPAPILDSAEIGKTAAWWYPTMTRPDGARLLRSILADGVRGNRELRGTGGRAIKGT